MSTIADAQKKNQDPSGGSSSYNPTELTAAPKTPAVAQRRNWARMLGGGLMVLTGGIAASMLFNQVDHSTQVLQITEEVNAGQPITESDLSALSLTSIDDTKATTFTKDEMDQVLGKYAVSDIPEGTILSKRMVTSQPHPDGGASIVALPINPSRLPVEGIHSGQAVRVVVGATKQGQATTPEQDSSQVDMTPGKYWKATVESVGGAPNDDGTKTVNLAVAPADASQVAAAAASEGLMLVIDGYSNSDSGSVISGESQKDEKKNSAPASPSKPSKSSQPSSSPSSSPTKSTSSSSQSSSSAEED